MTHAPRFKAALTAGLLALALGTGFVAVGPSVAAQIAVSTEAAMPAIAAVTSVEATMPAGMAVSEATTARGSCL
jgi:hypothetical protein